MPGSTSQLPWKYVPAADLSRLSLKSPQHFEVKLGKISQVRLCYVGAVFTVDGSDPRMVICYMPRQGGY
jgi:hypothetical protein